MRLPIRVSPDPCEGIWGWALRAAEANCYPGPATILSMVGFLPPIKPRSDVVSNLAEAAGASVAAFDDLITPTRLKGVARARLRGLDVPRTFLNTRAARVCPRCLAHSRVIPATWDLAFWSACPAHTVNMLVNCPQCHDPITWNRARIDQCPNRRCGYIFSDAITVSTCSEDITLTAFFARAIGSQVNEQIPNLNAAFKNPSADVVFRILLSFGSIARILRGLDKKRSTLLNLISHCLAGWPKNLHNLVKETALDDSVSISNRSFRVFDRVLKFHRIPDAQYNIIIRELFAAVEREIIYGRGDLSRSVQTYGVKFVKIGTAARMMNVTAATARRLYNSGVIRGYERTGSDGRVYRFLDLSDVQEEVRRGRRSGSAKRNRNIYLSVTEIYSEFGILPKFLCDFEKEKFIYRELEEKGGMIIRESIYKLFERLSQKCQSVTNKLPDDERLISLDGICLRLKMPLIDIVKGILDGRLRAVIYCSDRKGLSSLFVERKAAFDFAKQYRLECGCIQRQHAAYYLEIPSTDVDRLIKGGHLNEVYLPSGGQFRYIDVVKMKHFKEEYAPMSLLSKCTSSRSDAVIKLLDSMGLSPAIGASGKGSTSYWRWSDLIGAWAEAQRIRHLYLT